MTSAAPPYESASIGSYDRSASLLSLIQLTLALHRNRRVAPDATATIEAGLRRSWRETVDRIARRAGELGRQGSVPGERVALLDQNSIDLFEAIMAVLWTGAVFVPVNLRWSRP